MTAIADGNYPNPHGRTFAETQSSAGYGQSRTLVHADAIS